MKKNLFRLSVFLIFLFPVDLSGQQPDTRLTLEDIYQNKRYPTKGYRSVRWMSDNRHYTTLERDPSGECPEIIRHDAVTGEREMLVASEQLVPANASEPIIIKDYLWSPDQSQLLLFTNTRRVWRYETRGDYWLLDTQTGSLKRLGGSLEPATLMFAKFSPDGTKVGYVSENNLYVEKTGSAEIIQLTTDGGSRFINGTFDWLYEEEFSCRDGFRWSEDGSHIIYWHSDTRGTGTFYMINNLDSIYSQPIPFPYPKVGTTNSAVKIGVVPSDGGVTRWFDIPGDPRNHYLVRMEVVPYSSEVLIQQLNRRQNTNRLWIGNIENMTLEHIFTERDDAFLDVHDQLHWLEGNRYFTWISERNGWRQLFRVSRDGQEISPITDPNYDVISLECIDSASGYGYFSASPGDPIRRYLYRTRLDGKGRAERVSPTGMPGHHHYQMTGNAAYALHTFENASTPLVISLIRIQDHANLRTMEDNRILRERYDSLGLNNKEFFRVDVGDILLDEEDILLDAWMIKPPGFDPSEKYPVIFHVYGEPASSTVQDRWSGGDLWHQYLAGVGYVVISVDNRGTAVPRGRAWRKSIYRQIGILATKDQAAAVTKILGTYPYLDPDRVGVWGWSGGGSMTLNCMFRYPGIYTTGIAVAFVSHQKLYDTAYQERYMDLPGNNPEGYERGSPITHAARLEGDLLLIHGTADDNVHYQSFEWLVDELIKHGKQFDMMSYPMRTHSISERENTPLHLRQTMARFWKEHL